MIRFALLVLAAIAWGLAGCAFSGSVAMPPLIGAARDGDVARLDDLLRSGVDPNIRAGVNGWTPLMHAIHKNQPASVRVLLAHGARPDERGGGVTALIMAAGYGYTGIVRMLLDAGADPRLKSDNGGDALSAAVGGVPDIDRFTVGHCQTDTVSALLAVAPDLRLRKDSLAFRVARFSGCAEVLKLLGSHQRPATRGGLSGEAERRAQY